MKYLVSLILCFITIPCFAGYNVCYDQDGKNLSIRGSSPINSCLYFSDQDMSEYTRVKAIGSLKYHKVVGGVVVEMTQNEIDAINVAEAQAQEDALLAQIDKYEVSNIDLITALVKVINVRIPGNVITKQEMIDQIKSDLGLQ